MKHFLLAALVLTAFNAYADSEKKLPKTGVLASTGGGSLREFSAPDVWGGNDISGDAEPPITASIVRASPDKWVLTVTNTTEDPYSLTLQVTQTRDDGSKLNSTSYSFSLRPGESDNESITANSSSSGAVVALTNWKNNAPKKPAKDKATEQTPAPK